MACGFFFLRVGMRVIKVFPDYCSSGLWEGHKNLAEERFMHVLTFPDLMALRYWHHAWEMFVNDSTPGNNIDKMSHLYWKNWSKHGQELVNSWNAKQTQFLFVYEGDYWK